METENEYFVAFFDVAKAFDSVWIGESALPPLICTQRAGLSSVLTHKVSTLLVCSIEVRNKCFVAFFDELAKVFDSI